MKIVIYQLFVRLFGNKNTNNIYYGSIHENGCGKFNDINEAALKSIKELGVTHIWYMGILEHATMSDFSAFGIPFDNPDVVKGRAGSPYAIRDYYDVSPELAIDVPNRVGEFEDLITRTKKMGFKVIIDFVPNHVARGYRSDSRHNDISDLGENDDKTVAFSPNNNFYYLPNQEFKVPEGYNAGGPNFVSPLKDGRFREIPAKATGNDVFLANPSLNDWFETIKLNYGVDYSTGKTYFDPIPDTWKKMLHILEFWIKKGMDGFRCDMCEMVPLPFWNYATTEIKSKFPEIQFIGEAYNPNNYRNYLVEGGFDYLYDKVGLYDILRAVIEGRGSFVQMSDYYHSVRGFENRMLSFMENHDEQRIASDFFAKDPFKALSAMTICATLNKGAVMIYFGQELGVTGMGETGFSGNDGRTSIFDYTHIAEIQTWMNKGKFDDELLSLEQKQLRKAYIKILNLSKEEIFNVGEFYDLQYLNSKGQSEGFNEYKNFAYLRYTAKERVLIVATCDNVPMNAYIKLSRDVFESSGLEENVTYRIFDLLGEDLNLIVQGKELMGTGIPQSGLKIQMKAWGVLVLKLEESAK